MAGPLAGYRIIEIAGIGPGPFAAMMLADMGAEVIRVERVQAVRSPAPDRPHLDVLARGRRSIAIDLKQPDGVETLLGLVEHADALIEGFRPGVMERLGVGPEECAARNPRLVYGRMTGWGQSGPYARPRGHDINYISLAGALAHFGRHGGPPTPPLNMVGDFGGGGMFLAYGVVCALLEAQKSGTGQVVDTAMVDGTAVLMTMFWAFKADGHLRRARSRHQPARHGRALLRRVPSARTASTSRSVRSNRSSMPSCSASPAWRTIRSSPRQMDKDLWPHLKSRLIRVFEGKTRDEWCAIMEHTDVCFAPVLTMSEAAEHPHNVDRGTFIEVGGVVQPAPAPRFSRTTAEVSRPPAHAGQHTREVLADWGVDADAIDQLFASGAVK